MIAECKRWNWINGFVTASLHAFLESHAIHVSRDLEFQDVVQEYRDHLRKRMANLPTGTNFPHIYDHVSVDELQYLFHLESELWGQHFQQYIPFFKKKHTSTEYFETFRLVLAFYILERFFYLFLPRREMSRFARRKRLFGKNNGIFSSRHPNVFQILGLPFSLSATTNGIDCSRYPKWRQLCGVQIPDAMRDFYMRTTRKDHFCGVLEGSFKSARSWLRTRIRVRNRSRRRELLRGAQSWIFDVFWRYSESVRYNPITVVHVTTMEPFYWNRSIRWLTSLFVTGIAFMADQSLQQQSQGQRRNIVRNAWQQAVSNNPILRDVFGNVSRFG